MQRSKMSEMRQFFGFSYYSFEDGKFRTFYPVDIIEGALLESVSADSGPRFEDLIWPYGPEEVESILKKSKRFGIVENGKRGVRLKPDDGSMFYTEEVTGTTPSRSCWDLVENKARIRQAFDPFRFEVMCTDNHFGDGRWICGVWSPIIREQWGLPILANNKNYTEPICTHLAAVGFRIKRDYGFNAFRVFGFEPDDYMKPYVLAYLDVLDKYPHIKSFLMDYAFTYFSPMFDDFKKDINQMRRQRGLGALKMYDDSLVTEYLNWRFDEGLSNIDSKNSKGVPGSVEDVIETIGYRNLLRYPRYGCPASSLSQPSHPRPLLSRPA